MISSEDSLDITELVALADSVHQNMKENEEGWGRRAVHHQGKRKGEIASVCPDHHTPLHCVCQCVS